MKNKKDFFKLETTRTKHGLSMKISHYGFNDIELIGVLERTKLSVYNGIMEEQRKNIEKEPNK